MNRLLQQYLSEMRRSAGAMPYGSMGKLGTGINYTQSRNRYLRSANIRRYKSLYIAAMLRPNIPLSCLRTHSRLDSCK